MQTSQPRWWFELHAPVYDRFDAALGRYYDDVREMGIEMLEIPEARPFRVLDLGAGTGIVSERILRRFPLATVTLLDASPSMLEQARAKLSGVEARAEFVLQNLEEAALSGTWDAVISCDALHHVTPPRRWALFREIRDSLAPRGVFVYADILCTPLPERARAAHDRLQAVHRREALRRSGISDEEERAIHEERHRAREEGTVYGAAGHAVTDEEIDRGLRDAGFESAYVAWRYFDRFLLSAYV
jgi:ubiquinone/menaquinone biosynthesis C-methylase UbiE